MTPSTDTNVTPGLVGNRLGNGVAEVATGEEARRDRERARDMPYGQEIGPIWWNMDPNQIQPAINELLAKSEMP